jgi:teichuronic acid biosynthesis glycosyltransferase TuaC
MVAHATEAVTAPAIGAQPAPSGAPRVLVFTTLFPNPAQPRLGVFVRDRVAAVAAHHSTRVVAPILVRSPARRLDQGSSSAVPLREQQADLEVHHPRFTTFPAVGRAADALMLYWQTVAAVRRLRAEFPFDLIDAHYGFPDGAAAVMLGKHFGVPVSVTVRGGDIDLLPRYRLRRGVIARTLQAADLIIAVSEHLARGVRGLGALPHRIRVIPNGIDGRTFAPIDQRLARQRLEIQPEQRLLVCVGNLLAEKGQHILVEALGRLRARDASTPHVAIIGSDQWGGSRYLTLLTERIAALDLGQHVRLLGSQPQEVVATWYAAADLLVLPTFREGCPNVVREALACGTPVVASNVGGVPELITSDAVGLLVRSGDVDDLANALQTALQHRWDRAAIAAAGSTRHWSKVAESVSSEFHTLASSRHVN